MYKLKRLLIFLLAFLGLAGFLLPMPAHASTVIPLGVWYSTEYKVGRWLEMPTLYYYTYPADSSGNPSVIPLSAGVNNARIEWSDALGVTILTSSTNAESPFRCSAITVDRYNQLYPSKPVDSEQLGITKFTSTTEYGIYSCYEYSIRGYIHHRVDCYVFPQSNHGDIYYIKTITHEIGHGLGWYGHANHSTGLTWVMCQGKLANRYVRDLEAQHLRQVYELGG